MREVRGGSTGLHEGAGICLGLPGESAGSAKAQGQEEPDLFYFQQVAGGPGVNSGSSLGAGCGTWHWGDPEESQAHIYRSCPHSGQSILTTV